MKNITETIELDADGRPKDPWSFAKAVERSQEYNKMQQSHTILFNKGRYFETSIYNKNVLNEVSELIKSPIQFNNMIADSWRKLEDFVIAMNCFGIYVNIDIDWI